MPRTTFPISATSRPGRKPAGAFFVRCALLLLSLLLPPLPAFASHPETAPATASVAQSPLAPDFFSFHLPGLAGNDGAQDSRFKGEFRAEYPKEPRKAAQQDQPTFLLQRGVYGGSNYSLLAEMGDISLKETRNTLQEVTGRGGRFSFLTASSGNKAKFETFAASGANGSSPDDMLVGATGEVSFLEESARFKTIYLSARKSLDKEGRWPTAGARRGDVVGFVAQLEPFRGKLSAEGEFDYSVFDGNTADDASALHDNAYRLKVATRWGPSRYTALYERTGPGYRLMADGPKRDCEGGSLGVETSFELHAFDFKLSRYNDNTGNSDLYPRLYQYEGLFDYRFKGFKALPLALQYRKTFIDSTKEPLGYLPKEVAEDAVSGQVHYLAGSWDFGLRGGLSQRMDRLLQQRESSTASFGFLPRFVAGTVTVTPDFSLQRITDFSVPQRIEQYVLNLGVNGTLLESRLDYEVKGGYQKESSDLPGIGKEVVGAKVKAAYPLARLFKWSRHPSLGIRGEYKETIDFSAERRESDFSLLISLDGGTFL